jgi:hypothetical protein
MAYTFCNNMKYLALIIAFACGGCTAINSLPVKTVSQPVVQLGEEVPQIFKVREFNCATLAEAANYYIALGEAEAIQELKALEEDFGESMDRGFYQNGRIGWVCRIIFKGKSGKPLRPPLYGGLLLPRLTMPLERWPLYPVAESDGVFFVLSEGYMLAGVAEQASDYIDYCSATGSFRKTKVEVPTQDEAVKAFNSFKKAKRWTMIKWKDEGPGTKYTMSEDWVLHYIEAQATSVPKKYAESSRREVLTPAPHTTGHTDS